MAVQLLVVDAAYGVLVAQTQHAVGLIGAHLLHQAHVRPIPLVVFQRPDGVQQILPLAVHIRRHKAAVAGDGVQQQLAHQLRHRLQQLFPAGGKGVVDALCHEAHALPLPFLANGIVDGGAVEGVQGGAEALHVRVAHGAPAQHRRHQGVIPRRLPAQVGDELHAEQARFELALVQVREIHVLHDLLAGKAHGIPPFRAFSQQYNYIPFYPG